MQDLKIALIQIPLAWEDKTANLANIAGILPSIRGQQHLILLPEMFNTAFSMKPEWLAEPMDGPTVVWMQEMAALTGSVLAGTLMICEDGQYYNRSVWMFPDGSCGHYDKRHLFRMGNEEQHYTRGNEKVVFTVNGWNIMTLTCYDLRFPEWSMNRYSDGHYQYDLLCYLANWPAARRHHWRTLLTARAIENQAFVAGVNRTGADGNGTHHAGDSLVADPFGNIIADGGDNPTTVFYAILNRLELDTYREKFFIAPDWGGLTEK